MVCGLCWISLNNTDIFIPLISSYYCDGNIGAIVDKSKRDISRNRGWRFEQKDCFTSRDIRKAFCDVAAKKEDALYAISFSLRRNGKGQAMPY